MGLKLNKLLRKYLLSYKLIPEHTALSSFTQFTFIQLSR